jgi:hypothetical protein
MIPFIKFILALVVHFYFYFYGKDKVRGEEG